MGLIESATALLFHRMGPVAREHASRLAIRQLENLRSPPSGDSNTNHRLYGESYRIRRRAILDDYTGDPSTARLELILCLGSGVVPLSALAVGLFLHSREAVWFGLALLAPWLYYSASHLRAYHIKRSLTLEQQCGVVDDLAAAGLVEPEEAKRILKRIRRTEQPTTAVEG